MPASACGCLYRDGHRFESPPLHQEVGASRPGFPAPTILRLFSALALKLMVCGALHLGLLRGLLHSRVLSRIPD
jgi:hypothetical protein